jgi:7,8-dihydro-6-hydroxymethylpterin-pyrophosphokinase
MFGTKSYRIVTADQHEIIIPHQSINAREFVLKPWADIVDDNFEIPTLGSIKNLLEDLK